MAFVMKRLPVIFLGIIVLWLNTQPCYAMEHKYAVGVRGGLMQFTGGSSWTLDEMELEMDNTLAYGASGSYFINEHFSIEATVEQYRDADGDVEPIPANTNNVSNIAQTFITVSPTLHWVNKTRYTPYIGAGLSYYFNDFEREDYFYDIFSRSNLSDSWGYQISVGTDVMITPAWAFNLDIRYQWTEPTFKWTLRADNRSGEDDFTLAGVMTTIGIKYRF